MFGYTVFGIFHPYSICVINAAYVSTTINILDRLLCAYLFCLRLNCRESQVRRIDINKLIFDRVVCLFLGVKQSL